MATKKVSFNIDDTISSMDEMSSGAAVSETESESKTLKDIPAVETVSYIPTVTKKSSKKAKKVNDDSALIGFRIPKAAKDQYIDFFSQYGMNLSEATKNALEYFIQDLAAEKVKITLTHHFERVED